MTMNDAFDERLRAAFADAAAPLERESESERFAKTVTDRLSRPDRKRVLILGGAGSTGSAIAGSQLETIFGNWPVPTDGLLAGAAFLASPEVLAAGAMAVGVALVAAVLPRPDRLIRPGRRRTFAVQQSGVGCTPSFRRRVHMSAQSTSRRITAPDIRARKGGEPIVCLTAYDAPMARILDPHCDLLLVGDSVGMVVHGLDSTVGVTLDMMILHGQAVMRGAKRAMVTVDMPFGSYEQSPQQAFENAARIMSETGCQAIKIESGTYAADTIDFMAQRSIPVMGHIGLRPQAALADGGFRAKGRTAAERQRVIDEARATEDARRLRHRDRGGRRGPRHRDHRKGFGPHHRHRRLGGLRRPDPGHAGHARRVRMDAEIRQALRQPGRADRRGGGALCRGGPQPDFPGDGPGLHDAAQGRLSSVAARRG